MTMRVRVTNLDSFNSTKVAEITGERNDPSKQSVELAEIPPGGSLDFWLHAHHWLVVEEKLSDD